MDNDQHAIDMCRRFFNRNTKPGTFAHEIQAAAARGLLHGGAFSAMEKAELADIIEPPSQPGCTPC
ncbi:hypothetical protein [Mycobacterium sp. SM3041]|uniref:hypothetical protein n=1 Tax=Mycobacterium sp. SM3041 TaxID=3114291 RepID=UPI0032047A52